MFFSVVLFSSASFAGNLEGIFFENSVITIHHHGCHLQQSFKEKRKLILSLANCVSMKGKMEIIHPSLKKIHWAQHDRNTVWIVATFAKKYQYEINSSFNQYRICLPRCFQPNIQKNRLSLRGKSRNMMFLLNDIWFQIPLQNMYIEDFLERSIGFVPKDIIRDGLPHFGAKRDDWLGKTRKHRGYDIYVDQINVIAAAPGTVTRIGKNSLAGLYVKLHHGSQLYTVYVHLKTVLVKKGQKIKRSDILGRIAGAVGNAKSPQLHFEIKINDKSVDPLPFIKNFYQGDEQIIDKIRRYQQLLLKSIQYRENKVRNLLLK